MHLNDQQIKAIHTTEGPLLILAGAGSGKTRVLTERIAFLMESKQVPSDRILAVTFTNKAAREMQSRLPTGHHYPWIGTFHGLCHKLLRIEIGTPFVIFDSKDQEQLMKNICKEYDINADHKPLSILAAISRAKNELMGPQDYRHTAQSIFEETVAKVFPLYQNALRANQAMDFDDLISNVILLFNTQAAVLEKYQRKFQYISVDEYQDTNYAQYTLIKHLAEGHHNLCAVGDTDQCIYSWRGANIENLLRFEKDFPHTQVILLEQNYRSTQTILTIANHVIEKNEQRQPKTLWTQNEVGDPALFFLAEDEIQEAHFIAEQIQKTNRKQDTVVLYRTNAQSRTLEDTFLKMMIPYRMIGGVRFYERKEVKDVLAYIRYLYNPADHIAYGRIEKLPGIKKFLEAKASFDVNVAPSDLIEQVLSATRYRIKLEAKATEEAISRVENIDELIGAARDYDNLGDFLGYTTLITDADTFEGASDAVTLMTLHSAKGLEFPLIYLTGCEEGLLPHYRARYNPSALEEERRLFYVGITRAKEHVTFTAVHRRFIFGDVSYNTPSRFLEDIPEAYMITQNAQLSLLSKSSGHKTVVLEDIHKKGINAPSAPSTSFVKGDVVHHTKFGSGIVQDMHGDNLVIRFSDTQRLLSSRYAPLTKGE